jgi:hypothetical protein
VGVDFCARADRTEASDAAARYANRHAEMCGFMKEWCNVGCLPDDNELSADLKAVAQQTGINRQMFLATPSIPCRSRRHKRNWFRL